MFVCFFFLQILKICEFCFFVVKMKIAAFNVKQLGRTKVNNELVRTNLIKVTHCFLWLDYQMFTIMIYFILFFFFYHICFQSVLVWSVNKCNAVKTCYFCNIFHIFVSIFQKNTDFLSTFFHKVQIQIKILAAGIVYALLYMSLFTGTL